MASELITGFAGAPHVGSDDMGAFQAGILGTGSYVLQTGQQLKATVASANKVTIGTGDLVMNGRHVRMATATDLTIQNGTQGQKRNDLIVCRYSKASDGKETATLVVVKGTATSGTPADPSYNKTSILDGASVSDMPLYRIPITNLSVGTPVQLFKVLTPLDTVGDSVTQSGKITPVRGWVVQDQPYWVRIGAVVFLYGTVKPNYGWGTSSKDSPFDLPFKPATFGTQIMAIAGARTGFINFAPRDGADACWFSAPDNTGDYPAGTYFFLNGTSYLAELPE